MDDKYSKNNGNLDLRPTISQNKVNPISSLIPTLNESISSEYSKGEGNLDPSLFIIVSGGEVRELDYFSFFQSSSNKFPRIKLEFVSKDSAKIGGLDIDRLVALGLDIKKQKEESKDSDLVDSINLITDVDHFYSRLLPNKTICEAEGLKLVISNPCFELWLYYSYFDTKPNYELPKDSLKISSGFKTYLPTIKKGGIDPRKAPLIINNAITNSKKNYEEDVNQIPQIFSTQMHFIAEKLYELTKDDIVNIIRHREKLAQSFKDRK